jgi:hypothetical protein
MLFSLLCFFKGTVAWDFWACFLGCMGCKPVLTSIQQLNWICQIKLTTSSNDRLSTFHSIDFAMSHKLQPTSNELPARRNELQATGYELQVMSYEIWDASYELRHTRYKITHEPANGSMLQHLDRSLIAWCRPALYIDRTQLIIRHLHWLMSTVQVLYRAHQQDGTISKLKAT